MTFSQYAGISIVPTLARIVLCVAFVSAGYNKVFRGIEVDAKAASRLKELGIEATPNTAVQPASQESPATTHPAGATTAPATAPATSAGLALPTGTYSVRGVHALVYMLDQSGMQYPKSLAWVAALTELLGGTLIFVGLFSRMWGLGLSITMGVAFYMTSLAFVQSVHPLDWATPAHGAEFATMLTQLGLFVLAFGVMLTGPGPLSLDRFLFGGAKDEEVVEVVVPAKAA